MSGKDRVVLGISGGVTHPDARYIGPLRDAPDYLVDQLSPPAVLLTMGAGDGYQVGEWVLAGLSV